MAQKSLGLIETIGLTAAIEAADAAVKSANVQLVGYELSRGGGMTTVKVEGDVGAVNAAISAARTAAAKVGTVVSVKVIPRPSSGIEGLVRNDDTVGYEKEVPPPPPPKAPEGRQGGQPDKSTRRSRAKPEGTKRSPKADASKPPEPKAAPAEPKAPAPEETAAEAPVEKNEILTPELELEQETKSEPEAVAPAPEPIESTGQEPEEGPANEA